MAIVQILKRSLRRSFQEIRRGENIELHIAPILAIGLVVADLLDLPVGEYVASLTLAVLALLVCAMLANRRRLEDIRGDLVQIAEPGILASFPDELEYDLKKASDIWLLGVHASSTLGHRYALLKSKLQAGAIIRALVVDPDSPACAMAAARHPDKPSIARERVLIGASLSSLRELKATSLGKLQIRVINDPLPYGGFMLDPEELEGAIYLKRYSFRAGLRPILIYRPENRHWFDFIKSEINALWDYGTEWPCDQQTESS